ncbi:MAG TPA: hypothetical protein VJT49_03565 [Amycolatopsis sp.]|uniref:hypothetical protein n=1 Tax=Amycolatopsis sp. TaxID=37632 RepID=UPI002B49F581|nr:hypothetical protein [Amycolatopsis sp.]HKS44192.1 hypothetical protein [Amycolatopsis sp.]
MAKWKKLLEKFSRSACSPKLNGPIGRRRAGSWRQYALARILQLKAQSDSARVANSNPGGVADPDIESKKKKLDGVDDNLAAAADAAARMWSNFTGAAAERTWNNVDAADQSLHELPNEDELPGWGIDVLAVARRHLPANDPRRVELEILLSKNRNSEIPKLNKEGKTVAIYALKAANAAASIERMQARSFRNMLYSTSLALAALAAGLVVFSSIKNSVLDLCIAGNCPAGLPARSGYDVLIVETIGLAAAALTAALSLRKLDGTSTPYSIPMALFILKLPAGALSAVIGVILMNADTILGLGKLTNQGQILAWAALFGAGQLALTRFVDAKGQEVLDNVRAPGSGPREPSRENKPR